MSVIVNKTKTGPIRLDALQREINANPSIVPSCLSISLADTNIALEFAAALSGDEDTELDNIITNHVPPVDNIDANVLPISALDDKKLAVHSSPKPSSTTDGSNTKIYSVWTGAGDSIANNTLGNGPIMDFHSVVDVADQTIKAEFLADSGCVWIHEGYLKFENAGAGDYVEANIRANATPLQQSTNLDLEVNGNGWVTFAAGGPGTGTHGFNGTPILIPRTFSKDGDWDYDGVDITPNAGGTGAYKINQNIRTVHRFCNRLPCYGSSGNYFTMSSDETFELPTGYYIQVRQVNVSNTVWHASVLMEIYRERTHKQQ